MPTLIQRLRSVEASIDGPERFFDLRLDLTDPAGNSLLSAGGRWDKTFGRFLDPASEGDAESTTVIQLQESQVEFVSWFTSWLCEFRAGRRGTAAREIQLAMMAGDRRGGKTFAADAAVIAACIDVPVAPGQNTPLITWIVSKSFRERFELEQWILNRIPREWYHHRQAPEHEFTFIHGSILRLLSADDPDSLKQGRVDVAFINEPQKIAARAVSNVVLGTSDLGGLTILAANPPSGASSRGEWLFDLKDAIDNERAELIKGSKVDPLGVRYFHIDSKKNKAIDQIARHRAGRIAVVIDPTLKAGDVEGEWRRAAVQAAWEFDRHKHLARVPALGLADITNRTASSHAWGNWVSVGGVDFQNRPHIVGATARIFGDPDDPTFWFTGEVVGEKRESEEQFLERFEEYAGPRGWTRKNFLWIGDASSSWQGAKHDFEAGERDSFAVFRDTGWEIIPPQDPKGKTGRARNPEVADRLQLVNELLRRGRIFIDPDACPWLAECFAKATTKQDVNRRKMSKDDYSHGFDAASYLIWRLSPRRTSGQRGTDMTGFGGVKGFTRSGSPFPTG